MATIKGPQFYFDADNVAHQRIVTFLNELKSVRRGSKSQAITRLLLTGLYIESLDASLPDFISRDLEKGLEPDFERLTKLLRVLQLSDADIKEQQPIMVNRVETDNVLVTPHTAQPKIDPEIKQEQQLPQSNHIASQEHLAVNNIKLKPQVEEQAREPAHDQQEPKPSGFSTMGMSFED